MKDNKDIATIQIPEETLWKYQNICKLNNIEYNMTRYPTYWGFDINEENLSKLLYFINKQQHNVNTDILQKAGENKFGWQRMINQYRNNNKINRLYEVLTRVIYIMRNFCLRKNLKSPETMEVRR